MGVRGQLLLPSCPSNRVKVFMKNLENNECKIEGCNNRVRYKGLSIGGGKRYDCVCQKHHKMKFSGDYVLASRLPNTPCTNCGWDKAPCDRHRKDPLLGYTKENVVVLCPNCHREFHFNQTN